MTPGSLSEYSPDMMGAPDGMEDLAMSDPVNVLIRDPSEAELVAALEQASVPRTSESAAWNRWKTQREQVAANAEGQMAIAQLTGPRDRTTHVILAWWSDHLGSKHVCVRGGDKVNLRSTSAGSTTTSGRRCGRCIPSASTA